MFSIFGLKKNILINYNEKMQEKKKENKVKRNCFTFLFI